MIFLIQSIVRYFHYVENRAERKRSNEQQQQLLGDFFYFLVQQNSNQEVGRQKMIIDLLSAQLLQQTEAATADTAFLPPQT